ncbi:MAG: hypothetical protein GOMPHAMPRED_000788 [Gomphillus americanus]|uniref:Aminoglycoside phosphotransferase domain-containing protein n=1 Tax=Gomphillus americanus TaxID=1940652 RepID=A0A8H3F3V8_9LECA|nr:MAG: hypothetical protein GOMPHAMPRED_000788 [Gomphillus americanus]
MAGLLSTWKSIAELDLTSKKGSRINSILSQADFGYLARQAVHARRAEDGTKLPPDLVATFSCTRFMSGHNNFVLEVTFSDNVIWLARIHMGMEEQTVEDVVSEITTMRLVKKRTTIPVPKIYAFDATVNNPFGYQYILMELLHGKRTRLGLVPSVPSIHHQKVARQIANILLELSQITFDRIGRLIALTEGGPITVIGSKYHNVVSPMATSLEYFYGDRYGENLEIYESHQDDAQWNTASWILTTGLAHLIIPDLSNGPFPLSHQDLHFGNILFDDEFNISGVIDWSSAQTAPLESLCILPDFTLYKARGARIKDVQDFKNLIVQAPEESSTGTSAYSTKARYMAAYMASDQSELNSRLQATPSRFALDTAETFVKHIYGTTISWEQLVEIYGKLPIPRALKTS